MLMFLMMFACKGDPQMDGGPTVIDAVGEPPALPVLTVSSPERGAFTGASGVRVKGEVLAGSSALDTITLDDQGIDFHGGARPGATATFDVAYDWQPGINIIGMRTDDQGGERAIDGRAIYAGPVHRPDATIDQAVRLQLGPELLDDDQPDIDDVAALAELMLGDPSLADSIIGQPMESDDFVITPTALTWSGALVDIVPYSGSLETAITLTDVWMDFDISGTGMYSWVSTSGSAWVDAVQLDVLMDVSSSGGTIAVTPSSTTADLVGYGLTVDWFPDSLEDDLADWTQDTLEEQIASSVQDMTGDLVAQYLNAFVTDMELLPGVNLHLELSDLAVETDGLRFTLDAGISAQAVFDLPSGAGSAKTDGAPPSWPITHQAPFGVAMDDDFINQLLFALWENGSLSDMSFTGVEIGGLSGTPLPEPLGPADTVSLDLDLPPMLGQALQDDMDADLAIGELRLVFNREDGEVLDFSVNVRTGLTVDMDGSAVDLALDGRPAKMDLQIGVLRSPQSLDPGDLAALIRLMVPPLLSNASGFLPAFELPSIPLDSFSDDPALAGQALVLTDPDLRVGDGGWIVLTAALQAE